MRKLCIAPAVLFFAVSLLSCGLFLPDPVTPEELEEHVVFLTDDSRQGRMFGSAGIAEAEEYIASDFQKNGLLPVYGDGPVEDGFFLPVTLYENPWKRNEPLLILTSAETAEGEERIVSFYFDLENYPLPGSPPGEHISGEMVFAGYGIDAPDYGWNDYAGLDVENKIVLVFRHEPGVNDPHSVFDGTHHSQYATFKNKTKTAREKGALGLVLFDGPLSHQDQGPAGPPADFSDQPGRNYSDSGNVPGIHVSAGMISALYPGIDFREVQISLDVSGNFPALPPVQAELHLPQPETGKSVAGRNVAAYVPSRGNRRGGIEREERIIVLGAHHDHLGELSPDGPGDRIFNGADDNASGVSAVLELAEYFSRTRGTAGLLFVTFTAEEEGLYGSKQIFETLPWLQEKTIAMINFDMIGRNPDKEVAAVYSGPSAFRELLLPIVQDNYSLIEDREYRYISDSFIFSGKGIPSLFFFSGVHEDYHRPSDEAGFLDYSRMQEIAGTAVEIVSVLAEADAAVKK